jgi:hypothetical protein
VHRLLLEKGLIGRQKLILAEIAISRAKNACDGTGTCSDVRFGEVVCAEDSNDNAVYRNRGNSPSVKK